MADAALPSARANLMAHTPESFAPHVRPYLQRAEEFDERMPLVAYFLRTHVAHVCLSRRRKENKTETAFLMLLLNSLEVDKKQLGAEVLAGSDGRTVLTKMALMLFSKADDAERTGQCNQTIVRQFFTSSVLLEATGQFLDNGELDPIASEKRKYARFIAARMKKALDTGTPYVSPNAIEEAESADVSGGGGLPGDVRGGSTPTADNGASSTQVSPPPYHPPPTSPPSTVSAYHYTPPPSVTPAPASTQPSSMPHAQPASSLATPAHALSTPSSSYSHGSSVSAPARQTAPPSVPTAAPSMDAMIDAQKVAREAVSALQFYDYTTARKKLLQALQMLGGSV